MRYLLYNVRHSVVTIYPSLLIITLHSSVRKTLVYNDKKYPVPFKTLHPSSTLQLYDSQIREEEMGTWHTLERSAYRVSIKLEEKGPRKWILTHSLP